MYRHRTIAGRVWRCIWRPWKVEQKVPHYNWFVHQTCSTSSMEFTCCDDWMSSEEIWRNGSCQHNQTSRPAYWLGIKYTSGKQAIHWSWGRNQALYLFGSQGSESCHKAWTFSNTPKIEEIVTRLNGTKQFSVFDASNGFWQGELDNESSTFTKFNIPLGRYRWKWMPFVINSAWKFGSAKWESTLRGFTE